MNTYTEDALIEQPAIALFQELGWEHLDCFHERFGPPPSSTLGRETSHEVVLVPRLRSALQRLNPTLSQEAIEAAIEQLTRDRSILTPAQANREVHALLKDGVRVPTRDPQGRQSVQTVAVIDWQCPENNSYFLASQFWVSGDVHKRRADLIGFVNGLPQERQGRLLQQPARLQTGCPPALLVQRLHHPLQWLLLAHRLPHRRLGPLLYITP